MPMSGKLEITIKINALPAEVTTSSHGWKDFALDCDGVHVSVRLRPKMWLKLEQAAGTWPLWLATIAGKMGKRTADGFTLEEPAIQVFERKAKPDAAAQPAASPATRPEPAGLSASAAPKPASSPLAPPKPAPEVFIARRRAKHAAPPVQVRDDIAHDVAGVEVKE